MKEFCGEELILKDSDTITYTQNLREGNKKMENYLETDNMILQSVGLFSSWCLHKPSRVLFDCGDGASLKLGYKVFVPRYLYISHGCLDHLSGLLSFIGIRNKTKGANDKPLDIYYPKNDKRCREYINFCLSFYGRLKYDVTVHEISHGMSNQVGKNMFIRAFKTVHTDYSLGYCVYEKSRRLKAGISPDSVSELIKSGVNRDTLTDEHEVNLFAYTLDNCGFDTKWVMGVKEIVLDCTFLNDEDRERYSHATLTDCKWVIDEIKPKVAYLAHISPRYNQSEIKVVKVED